MKKYNQLLEKIPKINKFFKTSFFEAEGEDVKLLKLEKILSLDYPLLIIMAGCHGEEPAPPLILFEDYQIIAGKAVFAKVNLIIYPSVNPYGFDRGIRNNKEDLNCNRGWVHQQDNLFAKEAKVIKEDISQYKPKIFASLHEDALRPNEFYLFSFGNRKYEPLLLRTGKKYFPILEGEVVRDASSRKPSVTIADGVIFDDHDGSAEDFMYHQGAEFSCCTETPSLQNLTERKNCQRDIVLKLIEVMN